jgi:hypothetical protein
MTHQVKKFDLTLEGISDKQISQHRDILYAGYVTNSTNQEAQTADITKANQPRTSGQKGGDIRPEPVVSQR